MGVTATSGARRRFSARTSRALVSGIASLSRMALFLVVGMGLTGFNALLCYEPHRSPLGFLAGRRPRHADAEDRKTK